MNTQRSRPTVVAPTQDELDSARVKADAAFDAEREMGDTSKASEVWTQTFARHMGWPIYQSSPVSMNQVRQAREALSRRGIRRNKRYTHDQVNLAVIDELGLQPAVFTIQYGQDQRLRDLAPGSVVRDAHGTVIELADPVVHTPTDPEQYPVTVLYQGSWS